MPIERPVNYKYTSNHEWLRMENDETAVIGITDFAVKHLKDLVFIDLPSLEELVEKGKPLGEIESIAQIIDLNSPITGEVIEVNEQLEDSLDLVQEDPYNKGWMVKLRVADPSQVDDLMGLKAYERMLSHLK